MYVTLLAYPAKHGEVLSLTTSATQKTGLIKGAWYAVSNTGAAIAYVNTDGVTATSASLPVFPNETKIMEVPSGTINHIGAASTSLVINRVPFSGGV